MRVRPLVAVALALSLALVAGCNADGTLRLPTGVVYPSITPVAGTANLTVDTTFTFEGTPRTLSIVVDGPLYVGAQQAEKSVIRFGNARENDWISDYYPAFVFEKHQDAFFSAMIGQFRGIRDASGLDSDRYVELMTSYAQSLEYKLDPHNLSPKFPVETAAQQAGDCDDKALLLGGLLAREGYDVAILLFGPEQHVALGIKAEGLEYGDTGYAYIETTTRGFVGMPPDSVGNGTKLTSAPQVFKLGDGTKRYDAGAQVTTILSTAAAAKQRADELAGRINAADTRLKTLQPNVTSLKSRMDALLAAGDSAGYNALVASYNAAAAEYNAAAEERNALAAEHNRVVGIHTYIVEHLDDRAGTFAHLAANPL
ncbi:MAG: hypothetical protein D9V44_04950 [Actinobacteria bacterium]|nr:MAG: hypothetical protein D9V44_04950 [Actinomycetota bacterium]